MKVVQVVTDDQDRTTITADVMPFLASQDWQVFVNSTPSTPVCGASRAALLSGRRADNNGVPGNATVGFDNTTSILKAVQNTGAVVGVFGKYLNHYDSTNVPAGIDECWILHTGEGASTYFEDWHATATGGIGEDESDYPGEYVTDVIFAKAAAFLAAHPGDDVFCYIAPTAPHAPATPAPRHAALDLDIDDPPDWNTLPTGAPSWLTAVNAMDSSAEAATRALRLASARTLRAVDEGIDTLLDAADTIVFYCTDNANANGRKRLGENTTNMQKRSPFRYATDGLLRIRWPGAGGGTRTEPVDFLDIAATIVDLFDATPLATLDGASMATHLDTGDWTGWRKMAMPVHLASDQPALPKWRAILTHRWRYGDYYEEDEQELYDLDNDPHELTNVIEDHPSLAASMAAAVTAAVADPLWTVTAPAPIATNGTLGAVG